MPEVQAVYLSRGDSDPTDRALQMQASPSDAPHLSARQLGICRMMAGDLTLQQIASRIGVSNSTVRMESIAIS